jgi:predicted dehydrogenase
MTSVGIIGTGFGANVHVPAFRAVPDVEIAAIAGQDVSKTERIAGRLGIARAYDSWERLVNDDRVTAVVIAVPPARHHDMVVAALRAGKHVLCEKPLGLEPGQAQNMMRISEETGLVGMVDYLFRMAPERVRLKELLAANRMGRIVRVNIEWTLRGRAAYSTGPSWQFDPSSGGGVLFGFGSHVVDYLEWLLGPIRSVAAHLGVRGALNGETRRGRDVAEDTMDALLVIGEDIPVSVTVSNAVSSGRGHWLTIYGEQGSLAVGNANLDDAVIGTGLFESEAGRGELRRIDVESQGATGIHDGRILLARRLAETFISALREGRPASPSFADGWRAHVVMEAIRAAHQNGSWISVPSVAGVASSGCRIGLNR